MSPPFTVLGGGTAPLPTLYTPLFVTKTQFFSRLYVYLTSKNLINFNTWEAGSMLVGNDY